MNNKNIKLNYPKPRKDNTSDNFFGTIIDDPYRWMEKDSKELDSWLDQEIALTDSYLAGSQERGKILKRLREIYSYDALGYVPRAIGGRIMYDIRRAGANQPQFYLVEDGKERLLLDSDKLASDGTKAVTFMGASADGRYIGMMTAESGSDWHELEIMDLDSGKKLADRLTGVKFTNTAWLKDGFFYTRYDVSEDEQDLKSLNSGAKIYYHKMGRPQSEDRLIYEDPENPLRYKNLDVTEDEKFLILYLSEGTHGTEIHFERAAALDEGEGNIEFKPLVQGFGLSAHVYGNIGDDIYYLTNDGASNMKLMVFNAETGAHTELLPGQDFMIEGVGLSKAENKDEPKNRKVVISGSKDAKSLLKILDLDSKKLTEVALPFEGTLSGPSMGRGKAYFGMSSFLRPHQHYALDLETAEFKLIKKADYSFDPDQYVSEQHFFKSKDETDIPMFILHKKGIELDGSNPGFIYGYGGFSISIPPEFNPFNIALIERGFVFASCCLRGGLEYGEKWHRAGMLENKQNVFDDMAAGAEYLVKKGYTSAERLTIHGRSNGGLLVGATVNQRPDLFAVSLPQVGVLDMLRYHKFTVGWGWITEYGDPDKEEHFKFIYPYSPLHNIEAKDYPATMVITSDHDDRVVPAHSFKYAATLQEKNTSDNPVLLRVARGAGHGAGNALSKVIEEKADILDFILMNIK